MFYEYSNPTWSYPHWPHWGIGVLIFMACMVMKTRKRHRGYARQTERTLCRGCGTPHPAFAQFCRQCGRKLK